MIECKRVTIKTMLVAILILNGLVIILDMGRKLTKLGHVMKQII